MARLTTLTDEDIRVLAGRFGLGEVIEWKPIAAGTINSNFALRCASGRFFLRINEGKSEADVAYEAKLVNQLAENEVPTPRPLRAGERSYAEHGGKWVSAFPWVAGHHLERNEITPAVAAMIGGALGQLHDAGDAVRDLPERYGIYTFEALVERAMSFADHDDSQLANANRAIAEEIAWLGGQPESQSPGIIHGDLFRDNVLFVGRTDGDELELSALLDFEQASLGQRVYDLAVCVNAWCYDEAFDPVLVRSMVRGYQGHRGAPLTSELYRELRRAAWRFTVTRITDVYLAGGRDPAKDFRRYLQRLSAWRRLGESGLESWLA